VQIPELLQPAQWSAYIVAKAEDDAHYAAEKNVRVERLRNAAARGQARRAARKAARQRKVAEAFAANPHLNMAALARTLGVSRWSIYNDRRALGLP
jgi:hypothetical protein